MKTTLMRHVDFWVGIPVCFLLTFINYVSNVIGARRQRPQTPRKVLYIKLSELGAVILAYSLIKQIDKEFAPQKQYFLTFEKNKDIFEFLDDTILPENIFTIRDNSIWAFIADTIRVIRRTRREKIDLVFDLEFFSRFTAILSHLSNAPKRVGFYPYAFEGLYRGNLLTHKIQLNPLLHVNKLYLSLAQVVEQESKNFPQLESPVDDSDINVPVFVSREEEHQKIKERLESHGISHNSKLIILNPGEGVLPLREWPLENFIALSKKFLRDQSNYIIIVGEKNSYKKDIQLCESIDDKRCVNWTGKTTVRELLELFNIADALIINDCGLAHLASLTKVKTFIIFGPESPQIFAPLGENHTIIYSGFPCSPCLSALNHRKSYCKDNNCLKAISVDEVYSLVR